MKKSFKLRKYCCDDDDDDDDDVDDDDDDDDDEEEEEDRSRKSFKTFSCYYIQVLFIGTYAHRRKQRLEYVTPFVPQTGSNCKVQIHGSMNTTSFYYLLYMIFFSFII